MCPDLSSIESGKKYTVEINGKIVTAQGSEIISAVCPSCHGSGLVTGKGAEPGMCPVCDGMGMIDYSKASKIKPA